MHYSNQNISPYRSGEDSVKDDLAATLRALKLEAVAVLVFLLIRDLPPAQHGFLLLIVVAVHRLTVTTATQTTTTLDSAKCQD